MAITPWVIGQSNPVWALTWLDDANNVVNLVGATLSGRIGQTGQPGAALKNTPVIVSASNGTFNYTVATNEVVNPGRYNVQFIATFGAGNVLYGDIIPVDFINPT